MDRPVCCWQCERWLHQISAVQVYEWSVRFLKSISPSWIGTGETPWLCMLHTMRRWHSRRVTPWLERPKNLLVRLHFQWDSRSSCHCGLMTSMKWRRVN
jgi:hypothetical protein